MGGTKYWISVRANMSNALAGQWFWSTTSDGNDDVFAWRNNGDGFGSGCTNWTPHTSCAGVAVSNDLAMDIRFNLVNNPPVAVCQDITVQLDATGNATIVAADIDGGSSDIEDGVPVSIVASQTAFTCADVGVVSVDLTVTDSGGLMDMCTANVTVEDNVDPVLSPVADGSFTVFLDNAGNGVITYGDVTTAAASDACGITSEGLVGGTPDIAVDCSDVGTVVVTIEATDANGNTASADVEVNVVDDIPPVISCPMDVVASVQAGTCGSVINFADAVAIDGCGIASLVQTQGPASGSVFPVGVTLIEFTATDNNGNISTCSFNVTVVDDEDPVAVCQDITVELDEFGVATITPMDVDGGSSDNCAIDIMTLDVDTFDCSNLGANTVTLTITDEAGNSVDCTATVTVEDNTAPTIVCIGQPATLTDSESTVSGAVIDGSSDVVSVLSITADETITDLNVNLDISHTWVGDVIVTLESPAGTVVTLMDQPGVPDSAFGCSEDDILATFDDEGTNPVEDECNVGPAIGGVVIPQEMLSAFDGESTAGDWTLTVSDAEPAFDDGVLNSWGIEYSYEVVGAPLDVVLDADGTITIPVSDLLLVVDDNCGTTATVGPTMGATATGDNFGAPISADLPPTESVANVAESGAIGTDYVVESVELDITHTWDGDLTIDLISPAGTLLNLSANNGGSGDNYTDTVFQDGGADITGGSTPFTGVWAPQGGDFASTFDGEDINGDWTLRVTDGVGGDDGTLDNFVINFGPNTSEFISFDCSQLGENQVEVTVTDAAGNMSMCTATVNILDETAPIITCGPQDETASATDSPGAAIPDNDPAGVSSTISVADDFNINDLDVNVAVSHTWVGDISVTLESPAGTTVTIIDRIGQPDEGTFGCTDANFDVVLDDDAMNPVEDSCTGSGGPITGTFSPNNPLSAFNGESTLGDWTLTVVDNSGGDTGSLDNWGITYTYPPTTTEVIIELDENGEAEIDAFDIISSVDEACGISTSAVDIDEFTCADIGTPIVVTAFVSDASGNIAACSATVLVVDNLAPVITCPEDQTVDPGAGNLFYEVPDYFGTGEATATDNCTDPITVTTQDPAPGSLLADGVYTVTLTATDDEGNVATCDFELTVESILGVDNNPFSVGITMFPNPAVNSVTISNATDFALDSVMIYDVNGRLVSSTNMDQMGRGERSIDISALASGVYMVQIQGDDQTTMKRLIKQ
jgi:subtilisin-like proprotein convertase family protein